MKNESLGHMVYQHLMGMILSGQLKPGDRIPETKIADELGISRTPIREALLKLASDGIVNIYPNRFAEIAHWDEETIFQIGIVRTQLDVLAARLAIHNASNAEFIRIYQHAKRCLEAALQNDNARRIKEDCAFHVGLSEIGKNEQLHKLMKNIYLRIEFLQSWRSAHMIDPHEQYRQHEEIFNALMSRDEDAASMHVAIQALRFHNLERDYPTKVFTAAAPMYDLDANVFYRKEST